MKKNETPQLSSTWWKGAQPEGIAAGKDLEKALLAYENARKDLAKAKDEEAKRHVVDTLDAVGTAAKKLIAEIEKLVKNPPKKADPDALQNTVDALKKYPRVIESVERDLGKLVEAPAKGGEEEEDDDERGALGKLEAYETYLRKTLKRLRQKPMNFAVGLGKKPEDHRFVFHRTKAAKALSAVIKQETDLKRLTWGIAGADPDRPTVLVLALEGPQAPGIKKKGEKQLKRLKPLPFDKIVLMVEGEEAEDIADPDDADAEEEVAAEVAAVDRGAAFTARLKALLPRVQQLLATDPEQGNTAKLKASEAGVFARKQDFTAANGLLDDLEEILRGAAGAAAPLPPSGAKVIFTQSRLAWGAARNKVHAELQKLEAAILDVYRDYDVFDEVRNGVRRLDEILQAFDEALIDKLDEALNAEDAAVHAKLLNEAREIIRRYRHYLESDSLVRDIDANPFVPIAVESTMDKTLAVLEAKLV